MTTPTATRKKAIPKALRNRVWVNQFGKNFFGQCYCCEKKLEVLDAWHAAHAIAEIKGGKTVENNLRAVCAECNLSMGTSDIHQFKSQFTQSSRCTIL
jgi:5-methylcytosine-specific restriction endonuclease McrA